MHCIVVSMEWVELEKKTVKRMLTIADIDAEPFVTVCNNCSVPADTFGTVFTDQLNSSIFYMSRVNDISTMFTIALHHPNRSKCSTFGTVSTDQLNSSTCQELTYRRCLQLHCITKQKQMFSTSAS